jgi:hypothetical protein
MHNILHRQSPQSQCLKHAKVMVQPQLLLRLKGLCLEHTTSRCLNMANIAALLRSMSSEGRNVDASQRCQHHHQPGI